MKAGAAAKVSEEAGVAVVVYDSAIRSRPNKGRA